MVTKSIKMSPEYQQLCRRLLYVSAQSRAIIYLGNSDDSRVGYAVSGMSGDSVIFMLLNESKMDAEHFSSEMIYSFAAHEMGHINNFHFLKDSLVSADELDADYYSGFCCSREGIDSTVTTAAYKLLTTSESDIHPPYSTREISILQGWNSAREIKPFPGFANARPSDSIKAMDAQKIIEKIKKINAASEFYEAPNYQQLLQSYLGAACLIIPEEHRALFGPKQWFNVYLSVHSNSPSMPNDTLMSFIKRVTYGLHYETFREKFKVRETPENNFSCKIKTWGDFDVPIIVTFKDDSVATLVYNLRLKLKDDNPEKKNRYNILSHIK